MMHPLLLPGLAARAIGGGPGRKAALLGFCLIGLSAAAVQPVLAGRPLATDDAAIVEAGACQLEAWMERGRDHRATWLNPGCNPFGRTEFAFGGARVRPDDLPAYTLHAWQIKRMLREHDAAHAGYAIAFGGQRQRHGGAREVYLNGIATLPLAAEVRVLHINLGALRTRDADGRHTRATWGLAFDAEVATATRASLEAFGTSSERPRWQFGLRHELVPGHLQLDASLGSALGRWSETRLVTLGLVFVNPAFLH